jgi:hypothetical protein
MRSERYVAAHLIVQIICDAKSKQLDNSNILMQILSVKHVSRIHGKYVCSTAHLVSENMYRVASAKRNMQTRS